MNYSQVQYRPAAYRQLAVAQIAAYFVTHLTRFSEAAEVELAMLKGGTFKQLANFCDPEEVMGRAVDSTFDDIRVLDDDVDIDKDPLLKGIIQSAGASAMLMLADVYGAAARGHREEYTA